MSQFHKDLLFLSRVKEGIRQKKDGHYELPLPFKKENHHLPDNLPQSEEMVGEVQSTDIELHKTIVHTLKTKEVTTMMNQLTKFSDWSRVVRAIARLKRFVREFKGLQPRTNETSSFEERREAEIHIIRLVLIGAFLDDIKDIECQQKCWANTACCTN